MTPSHRGHLAGLPHLTVVPLEPPPKPSITTEAQAIVDKLEAILQDIRSGHTKVEKMVVLLVGPGTDTAEWCGHAVVGMSNIEAIGNLFELATSISVASNH